MRRFAAIVSTIAGAACVAPAVGNERAEAPAVATPAPVAPPQPAGPATFLYAGELTQGGWIRGQAPAGAASARLGEQALALDPEGRFFAAFDRDGRSLGPLVAGRRRDARGAGYGRDDRGEAPHAWPSILRVATSGLA